jgi:hypothetical protein
VGSSPTALTSKINNLQTTANAIFHRHFGRGNIWGNNRMISPIQPVEPRMTLESVGQIGWSDLAGVCFGMRDGNRAVTVRISHEALYGMDAARDEPFDYLAAFERNRARVEDIARWKYAAGQIEADGGVLVLTTDLSK